MLKFIFPNLTEEDYIMKTINLILLTSLSLSVLALPAADAAPAKPKSPPKFTVLDIDKSNKLQPEEFLVATKAGVEMTFSKLDKNKDGLLSKAEYTMVMDDEECE